ncbi:DUF4236 domain-containing protein [Thermophilibacter sp.]
MGWRFRKTIKIAPGVKLNVSKSGVSTTIGTRGASVNIGKRGVYRNLSIPGTRIYRRDKIADGHASPERKTCVSTAIAASAGASLDSLPIHPESPRSRAAMQTTPSLHEQLSSDPSSRMAEIWKSAPMLCTTSTLNDDLQQLVPLRYDRKVFNVPKPQIDELVEEISREADSEVKTLAFWKSYRLKNDYVKERIKERYSAAFDAWDKRRQSFEAEESERERKQNKAFDKQYDKQVENIKNRLEGNAIFMSSESRRIISNLDVPLSDHLTCSCSVLRASNELFLDVSLPPIEDLPAEELVTLKSGKTKVKAKTQKRLREDYACYVFSLLSYLSSKLLNMSPTLHQVTSSAHTLRKNKAGDEVDEYIYSGIFPRATVDSALKNRLDAEELCLSLENRCNMTKTKIFKSITPPAHPAETDDEGRLTD